MSDVSDEGWRKLSPDEFFSRLPKTGAQLRVVPPEGFFEQGDEADEANEETRIPPHDLNAEGAVLANILLGSARLSDLRDLQPSHFFSNAHARVYQATIDVEASGRPIDIVTVATLLRERGRLKEAGGVEYLTQLLGSALYAKNTRAYADTIVELGNRRLLLLACQEATARLYTGEIPHSSVVELLRPEIERTVRSSEIKWLSTAEIFAELEPIEWLVPGLQLVRGRPTLLAGYGFSGKTLMAQALAIAIASATPAWGHFQTPRSAIVKHLDYEQGAYATRRRYQRLAIGHDVPTSGIVSDGRLKTCVFPDVYLDTPGAVDVYCREIGDASLVIFDALRGATPSVDENDSAIRRYIDNLTRISEKTGAAFLLLHHAGKDKPEQTDPRQAPRGSSAIFDACGCVFTVTGDRTGPKRVQQTKSPAEAEGRQLDPFYLSIEDVEVGSSPTAGLRVSYLTSEQVQSQTGAAVKFQQLKDSIVALVASVPGLTSANSICQRVAGGSKDSKLAAIHELVADGKLRQSGGAGTPFTLIIGGEGDMWSGPVPKTLDRSGGPGGLSPGTGGPPHETGSSKTVTGPPPNRKAQALATERAAQAESDAEELLGIDKAHWKAHAAAKGWSGSRRDDARAVAIRKRHLAQKDADTLESLPAETDKRAWATEQEWSDERIKRAMAFIDEKK